MNAYQRSLFRHKKAVLILLFGITLFFAYHLKNISVESRTQMWFNKDDPFYLKYKKYKEEFGNDHLLIIGIRSQRLFVQGIETEIRHITEKVKAIEGVHSVISFLDIKKLPFLPEPSKEYFTDFFLSKDRRATQIIVTVTEEGSQSLRGEIVLRVRSIIEKLDIPDKEAHLSGSLFMGAELDRYAKQNTWKIILFTLAGISFILLLTFRKLELMLIILLTSIVAAIWAMGFYIVMGNAINLVTNMIVPLVLIISIAFGIHMTHRVQEEFAKTDSWKEAVISGVSEIWIPCFLTSLTTSVGFFSLHFSPSHAIAQFGLYSALAMLFEFIVFFHIFPLLLHLAHKSKTKEKAKRKSLLHGLLNMNSQLIYSKKKAIIFAFFVATMILAGGILRIRVNTNQLKYFDSRSELVKAALFFDRHFGGIYPVQVVLTSSKMNTFKKPEILKKILHYQNQAAKECNLSKEISLADISSSMASALHVNNPFEHATLSAHSSFFPLNSPHKALMNRLVDEEFTKTVVPFRASSGISSEEMMQIQSKLEALAEKIFDKENFSVELTGIIPLYAHFYETIVHTQIISFLIAFILVISIIGLFFRSMALTLVVALSNLISIIMIFGLMGYLGINLDAGTVMIASVAIGIIVDDTIHILFRLGSELKKHRNDYRRAIEGTVKTLGRALTVTSLVNGLGFLILILSDFKPARFFGILMALTMLSALLADLVLLPSLIDQFKLKIRKITL